MVLRIIEALVGALLAAGGGYFAWANRGSVDGMFPPEPGLSVWLFVAGLVTTIIGAVAVAHALGPRPKARASRIAEEEKRAQVLRQAEQFYTAKAEGMADVGVAEGEPLFPEGLRPVGTPRQPIEPPRPAPATQPPEPFRLHSLNQPPPSAAPTAPQPVAPPPVATKQSSVAQKKSVGASEVAPNVPPPPAPGPAPVAFKNPDTQAPARPFPAPGATSVIPRAQDAPPPVTASPSTAGASTNPSTVASAPANADTAPAAPLVISGDPALEDIRSAIEQNRLEDADRLLAATRKRMNEDGVSNPAELAQLTGLAGDHAAADGRLGSAKWLWRLALQRFAAAGAIDDPAARAVSERMRLADQ